MKYRAVKKYFLITAIMLSVIPAAFTREPVGELVVQGMVMHDAGEYGEAIEKYRQALEEDPSSTIANYEMALSYFFIKEYGNTVEHCTKVLALDSDFHLAAYNLKGEALTLLGRYREAEETLTAGIYYYPDDYRLYYNLGLAFFGGGRYKAARDAYVNSIYYNPGHVNSHADLGVTMVMLDKPAEGLLCYYMSLLWGLKGPLSKEVYSDMRQILTDNISPDKTGEPVFAISRKNSGRPGGGTEDGPAMGMEEFERDTEAFISYISGRSFVGEVKSVEQLCEYLYVPLLENIAENGFVDVMCRMVGAQSDTRAQEWLLSNPDRVSGFNEMLEIYMGSSYWMMMRNIFDIY